MSDEIAEFLRRAAQRRAQQLQQMQPPASAPAAAQQNAPRPPFGMSGEVVEAEVVAAEAVPRPAAKANKGGGERKKKRATVQRTSALGTVAEKADVKYESHLHEKFDHQLGTLSSPAENAAEDKDELQTRPTAQHPLLALLAQPENVRSAFLLSELLRRPEERW